VKRASDEDSLDKAYWLRSYSTDSGLSWRALRWARVAAGMVRQAGRNLAPASPIAGTGELRPT